MLGRPDPLLLRLSLSLSVWDARPSRLSPVSVHPFQTSHFLPVSPPPPACTFFPSFQTFGSVPILTVVPILRLFKMKEAFWLLERRDRVLDQDPV